MGAALRQESWARGEGFATDLCTCHWLLEQRHALFPVMRVELKFLQAHVKQAVAFLFQPLEVFSSESPNSLGNCSDASAEVAAMSPVFAFCVFS